ncbi:MAG: GtrA family protein [Bacillaceae bacterium]
MQKEKISQFIRFAVVGGFATLLHYAIYLGLEYIGVNYSLAYTVGYGLSFIFNFFASNYITFKTNPDVKRIVRFSIAHGCNYILQIVLLNLFIGIGIHSAIAPVFIYIIAVPVNFVLVRIALKG